MYNVLNFKNSDDVTINKWSCQTQLGYIDDWKKIHLSIKKILDPKLKWFQYRINRHILTTNKTAFKMNLTDNELCSFCNAEVETIIHLLWNCHSVQNLIKDCARRLESFHIDFDLSIKKFVLGPYNNNPESLFILTLKYYIHREKVRNENLNTREFLLSLKLQYQAYKQIFYKIEKREIFLKDWTLLESIF